MQPRRNQEQYEVLASSPRHHAVPVRPSVALVREFLRETKREDSSCHCPPAETAVTARRTGGIASLGARQPSYPPRLSGSGTSLPDLLPVVSVRVCIAFSPSAIASWRDRNVTGDREISAPAASWISQPKGRPGEPRRLATSR